VWYNKGNALDSLERYNEAIECFDKAIEIEPELVKEILETS
jgi:tetratricopeptide (TPR) repeat protein